MACAAPAVDPFFSVNIVYYQRPEALVYCSRLDAIDVELKPGWFSFLFFSVVFCSRSRYRIILWIEWSWMLFINLEPIFIFFKWTLDATIFQATSLRRSSVCRFLYRFLFQIKSLSVSLPSCVVSRRWNDLRCRRLCVLAVVDFGGVFRVFRASFRAIGRSWRHRRRRRLLFLFVVPYFVGWKEMETIFFSY